MSITKPMKAATLENVDQLDWADGYYLGTPKIDGYRTIMQSGQLSTSSFKPVPNLYINRELQFVPNGIDGELIIGKNFEENGAIRRVTGEPDFIFHPFDYVKGELHTAYEQRMNDLQQWYNSLSENQKQRIVPLFPVRLNSVDEIYEYEAKCLEDGYEGIMLRSPSGEYKCGRATVKGQQLFKIKRFVDAEAVVIGLEEQYTNGNEATKDNFGRSKRSTAQSGLVLAGTMGVLIGRIINGDFAGTEIKCGSGFTATQRQEIYHNLSSYMGKKFTFKYQPHGTKDSPRIPIFSKKNQIGDFWRFRLEE